MSENRTTVHHAIVDLYEVEDAASVTASHVCNYTGLQLHAVRSAMNALEEQNIIERDSSGVVTMVDNDGYYPLAGE